MKTAIYIEEGVVQVVLTPENGLEKTLIEGVDKNHTATLTRGSFYETVGGWFRQGAERDKESLIIRLDHTPQTTHLNPIA